MNTPSIIRIADHAERLSRLRLYEREGREIDWDEIAREYDRVCLAAFGHTADDFDPDDFPEDLNDWYDKVEPEEAEAFANQHGYSLRRHTGALLDDWEDFLVLVVAKARGLFATTPEKRAMTRLKREAEEFREAKKKGVISGR